MKLRFSNIYQLMLIAVVIPSNSTCCESGFSAANHIKDANASSMGTKKLDSRMRVYNSTRKRGGKAMFSLLAVTAAACVFACWF
eukprot:SAG11_NODE_38754_length_251_cov_0.486842_1_plen_83_part_11